MSILDKNGLFYAIKHFIYQCVINFIHLLMLLNPFKNFLIVFSISKLNPVISKAINKYFPIA